MRSHAVRSIAICCPFERAWQYLTDPVHLPEWAIGFAKAPPQRQPGRFGPGGEPIYEVDTPRGVRDLYVRSDAASGVIDFSYGTGGQFNRSPTRLVPEGDGVVYVFLQFAPPDLPPAQLEGIVMVVEEELALLKRQLED